MKTLELGCALAFLTLLGCQFDNRCGKDDLVYARGLCSAPDAGKPPLPPAPEGGADEGGTASPCAGACELIGRCIGENPMAATFLADQLTMLGFVEAERAGCVAYCDAHSAGAGDKQVLTCLDDAEKQAMCDASMLAGSLPAVDGVNTCCAGRADSEYCVAVCTALSTNPAAYGLVPSCETIAP